MNKVKKENRIFEIDCNNENCVGCSFQPTAMSGMECKLFEVFLDHIVLSSNGGWKRCSECINAEVK